MGNSFKRSAVIALALAANSSPSALAGSTCNTSQKSLMGQPSQVTCFGGSSSLDDMSSVTSLCGSPAGSPTTSSSGFRTYNCGSLSLSLPQNQNQGGGLTSGSNSPSALSAATGSSGSANALNTPPNIDQSVINGLGPSTAESTAQIKKIFGNTPAPNVVLAPPSTVAQAQGLPGQTSETITQNGDNNSQQTVTIASNQNGTSSVTADGLTISQGGGKVSVTGSGDPTQDGVLTNQLNTSGTLDTGNFTVQKNGNTLSTTNDFTGQAVATQTQANGESIISDSNNNSFGDGKAMTPPQVAAAENGSAGSAGQGNGGPKNAKDVDVDDVDVSKTKDKCQTSVGVYGGNLTCDGTATLLTTSQATTVGSQVAGSTVLNTMGGMQQQQMLMNGATQAQAYQAAASMQMKAATMQTMIGASQIAFGYLEQSAGNKHNNNAADLAAAASSATYKNQTPSLDPADPTGTNIIIGGKAGAKSSAASQQYAVKGMSAVIDANQGNNGSVGTVEGNIATISGPGSQITAKQYARSAAKLGQTAVSEQQKYGSLAKTASLTDYVHGAQTTAAGVMAMMAAKEAEALAAKLANASPIPLPSGADAFNGNPEVPRMPTVVGGNPNANSSPAPFSPVAAAPGATNGLGLGDLGGPGSGNSGPAPGAFAAGAPGTGAAPGGGSGGGLGGSTSTSAAPPGSAEDPQAKYANNGAGGAAYQGGGIAMGGGGGGKGGAGNDPISLKDVMAQMMGQGAGEKPTDGVDIMNYRNLASDSQYAPLSRNEDFFKHFHETYQGLQKKGRIGQ